ncbi:MAG: hypothetical protein WA555_06705 [Candidatus Sulfotelmatobacter sp.]
MPVRQATGPAALLMVLCLSFSMPSAAKSRPGAVLDRGYVAALAAADHFLQAWQSGDVEDGMALLTSHAKEAATTEGVEQFFSNDGTSGYEIDRGKLLRPGRYEFPIVLVSTALKNVHARRRFSSIVMVDTGHSDWAVDKLP